MPRLDPVTIAILLAVALPIILLKTPAVGLRQMAVKVRVVTAIADLPVARI
jgi:hypothetical protein